MILATKSLVCFTAVLSISYENLISYRIWVSLRQSDQAYDPVKRGSSVGPLGAGKLSTYFQSSLRG